MCTLDCHYLKIGPTDILLDTAWTCGTDSSSALTAPDKFNFSNDSYGSKITAYYKKLQKYLGNSLDGAVCMLVATVIRGCRWEYQTKLSLLDHNRANLLL